MDYLKLSIAAAIGVMLSIAYHDRGISPLEPRALLSAAMQDPIAYRNCAAARAAGAAPLRRGEPGYAPWLDRDNDGIGCE